MPRASAGAGAATAGAASAPTVARTARVFRMKVSSIVCPRNNAERVYWLRMEPDFLRAVRGSALHAKREHLAIPLREHDAKKERLVGAALWLSGRYGYCPQGW